MDWNTVHGGSGKAGREVLPDTAVVEAFQRSISDGTR
jgi:hypothetical protein